MSVRHIARVAVVVIHAAIHAVFVTQRVAVLAIHRITASLIFVQPAPEERSNVRTLVIAERVGIVGVEVGQAIDRGVHFVRSLRPGVVRVHTNSGNE